MPPTTVPRFTPFSFMGGGCFFAPKTGLSKPAAPSSRVHHAPSDQARTGRIIVQVGEERGPLAWSLNGGKVAQLLVAGVAERTFPKYQVTQVFCQ